MNYNSECDRVSIIIAAYNSESFIAAALDSVLLQTYDDWEVIVVNDGSRDATEKIVSNFAQKCQKIRQIIFRENRGVIAARNAGIEAAKSRFIAFLDSDDVWSKEKLERQVACLKSSDAAFSYSSYTIFEGQRGSAEIILKPPKTISIRMHLATRFIGFSTLMIDTKKTEKIFFQELPERYNCEDFLFVANLLSNNTGVRCDGVYTRYRLVEGSRSSNKLRSIKSVWYIMREKLLLNLAICCVYFCSYLLFSIMKISYILSLRVLMRARRS